MYPKSWRYRRDSILVWSLFFLMLATAGYALRHPLYWLAVFILWALRNPVRQAFNDAHPFRQLGWMEKTHLEFREVTFQARDGLTLFGRFVRSRNRATILLLHPLHSSSNKMLLYAEFLAGAGYGIFMIDLRAHGSSDGDTSSQGRREADDVAGAVDYLLHRLDVNGQKIGAFGIDLGAQAALRGALQTDCLRALVLESLGPTTLDDDRRMLTTPQRWIRYPFRWIYYRVFEFMCATKNTGVRETLSTLGSKPVLLIADGKEEIDFNRLCLKADSESKELWELPEADPGDAVLRDSTSYIQKVVGFFDKALL